MVSGAHIRLVLGRAAKAVEQVDRASIAGTGLGLGDFTILEALLHKGPLPINAIGAKVLLTSGSMTAAANRLEKKGLIERIRSDLDGRRYDLHLTRSGRRLIQTAYASHCRNLETLSRVLSEKERSELVRLLKRIGHEAKRLRL